MKKKTTSHCLFLEIRRCYKALANIFCQQVYSPPYPTQITTLESNYDFKLRIGFWFIFAKTFHDGWTLIQQEVIIAFCGSHFA